MAKVPFDFFELPNREAPIFDDTKEVYIHEQWQKINDFLRAQSCPVGSYANITFGAFSLMFILETNEKTSYEKLKRLETSLSVYIGAISCTFERVNEPQKVKLTVIYKIPTMIDMSQVFPYMKNNGLTIFAGLRATSEAMPIDLDKCPHLLIAGTTGSGKSVFLHDIIVSLMFSEPTANIFIVDPKKVEYSIYKQMSYIHVYTEKIHGLMFLRTLCDTMDARYRTFARLGVRDIYEYRNKTGYNMVPAVYIIDELAEIMLSDFAKEYEDLLCRVAQLGRACGIHLILATQRPSANIVTGRLKANIPARVAFHLPTSTDSITILGRKGAETLTGNGDGFYLANGARDFVRFKAPYMPTEQIQKLIDLANAD